MESGTTRRELLTNAALGTAALSGLRRLSQAREDFRADLEASFAGGLRTDATGMRDAYDLAKGVTYLNHASIGTIPTVVREALRSYQEVCEENPWLHVWGGAWEEAVASARSSAAGFIGCTAEELAITHNTTEAFNTLAHGLPLEEGDEILFSSLNHVGASRAWEYVAEVRGFRVRRFEHPVSALEPDEVMALYERQIGERTRVIALPHIDNTLGIRHPLRELAAMARGRGVRFIAADGAQAVGMIPVDLHALDVDFYATSAHKWLQTPKGLGLFYVRRELLDALRPMWVTWGHDAWQGSARIFEDYGTRDLTDVLSLGDAVAFQQTLEPAARDRHHRALHEHCRKRSDEVPYLDWRSPRSFDSGAALYALQIEGVPASTLARRLFEEHGIVVRAFETDELNTVRVSPNTLNTKKDIDRLFAAVEELRG